MFWVTRYANSPRYSRTSSMVRNRPTVVSTCCIFRKKHINPLNAELNPICHLLALVGAHHILHVYRIGVKTVVFWTVTSLMFVDMSHLTVAATAMSHLTQFVEFAFGVPNVTRQFSFVTYGSARKVPTIQAMYV